MELALLVIDVIYGDAIITSKLLKDEQVIDFQYFV
jgi:hypothetical protein